MTSVVSTTPTSTELLKTSAVQNSHNDIMEDDSAGELSDYGGHFLLQAAIKPEVKNELAEDMENITSRQMLSKGMELDGGNGDDRPMPKIRLTPTIKLLATPNPVDPKRKFVCPYENCTKSYGKSSHLRSHLTWHTGVKPFVCKEANCGKGFTRSDELNRHVRTHTGEKPFQCIQCTKKFSRSDHLTKHLATHAKQMQNNSTAKPRANGAKPDLKQDLEQLLFDMQAPGVHFMTATSNVALMAETTAPEKLMDIKLERPDAGDEHRVHSMEQESVSSAYEPIKIKLERPEYNADYQVVPPSMLSNDNHCRRLQTTIRNEAIEPTLPSSEIKTEPNAVDEELMIETNTNESNRDNNNTSTEQPFRCNQCAKLFRRQAYLNRHMRKHTSEPYNLQQASPNNVSPLQTSGVSEKNHVTLSIPQPDISKPDPERPFQCRACVKAFRRQDDLNRHMRTHTGEKPYQCNECDRRFVRSDHLKKHMNTHIRIR